MINKRKFCQYKVIVWKDKILAKWDSFVRYTRLTKIGGKQRTEMYLILVVFNFTPFDSKKIRETVQVSVLVSNKSWRLGPLSLKDIVMSPGVIELVQ